MNVVARRLTVALASTGLLVGVGLTTAEAANAYTGSLTFGKVTITRNCDPGATIPTSVTYSVSYNANGLNTSIPAKVTAQFTSDDATPSTDPSVILDGAPAEAVITARTATTITATVDVPTTGNVSALRNVEMSLDASNGGPLGPTQDFKLLCSSPAPLTFNVPTVSVNNPCLGMTSVRVSNASGNPWLGFPIIRGNVTDPTFIPNGRATVVNIGSALRGAENFTLLGNTFDQSGDNEVLTPFVTWSAPCKPGRPATTLTGVRKGTRNVLTAAVKPGFGGAPVKFFRVLNGHRTLVGTAKTGPLGKAVFKAPRRANTRYVAVVGATHWSVATTTPTRLVR